MIRDFLKNNRLLSDGAMGTYYSSLTGDSSTRVELSNILSPDIIKDIHKSYIDCGAKLIRTNTFAANSHSLNISKDELANLIQSAWEIAKIAIDDREIFIAGDIGPIPTINMDGESFTYKEILDEYYFIIDTFIELGCTIFNFETFSSVEYLSDIIKYLRHNLCDAFIMVQLAIDKSGLTRNGFYVDDLYDKLSELDIDLLGLNCGSGPTHLVKHIGKFQTLYANAGYPEIINNRTVYNSSPEYYANVVSHVLNNDVKIIGGCCGTTPKYIRALGKILNGETLRLNLDLEEKNYDSNNNNVIDKNLIIAVELDPPSKPDLTKIIENAHKMKNIGVDYITLADSPSGRMRLNPITVAGRIKRDVSIKVIPHVCCRDRNLIALKSDILAAHTEGIRDILIVTGDPIPLEERDEVRKVFNCNSVSLIKQVEQFNKTILKESVFNIGAALNLSSVNLEAQKEKMLKKIEAGAKTFLTQPIYDERSINFLLDIKKPDDVKILAGVLPIVTYKNAMFLNNEFPGISIPDNIISRFNSEMSRSDAEETGINISIEIVNKLKGYVDGFYFMTPFNRTNMISEIIKRGGLR